MRRKPERFNIWKMCVLKNAVAGKKQPPPSGMSTFDLLQYVCENGGARKVIVKQPPPPSLEAVARQQQFLGVLEELFESQLEEEPRVRPITLKQFFEESPEKPGTLEKMNPLGRALFLCLNLHLELPDWVLFGLGESALALVCNQKPRTGRHTSLDARLDQLTYDFQRWQTVTEIRENGSPRTPGRKMNLPEAIEEAAEMLKGTRVRAGTDAVRKSYFKVKKNWVWYFFAMIRLNVDAAVCERDRNLLRQVTINMENYYATLRKGLA